jgi:hypothetical protein
VRVRMSSFDFDGHRLVYDGYGAGNRLVVLMPGLLLSRLMHRQLAEALAECAGTASSASMCSATATRTARRRCVELLHDQLRGAGARSARSPRRRGGAGGRDLAGSQRLARDARTRQRSARLRTRPHPAARGRGAGFREPGPKPSASVLQGLFFGRVAPPREMRRAGARAAERPPSGGVLDPRAASGAGAPDRGDRRLHARLLSREATPRSRRRGPAATAEAPLGAAEGSH